MNPNSPSVRWCDKQSKEFLKPQVCAFTEEEAREALDDPEALSGFYARLSADGYLDCTEWQGPYLTVGKALKGLYDTYGDES